MDRAIQHHAELMCPVMPPDLLAAEAVEAMSVKIGVPLAADTAIEGRHLLQRMVDYMPGQGIRQFLDLGSGLPSMANTHQIALREVPDARVVYKEDPWAVVRRFNRTTATRKALPGRGGQPGRVLVSCQDVTRVSCS
jgi:S-adenosyl methyltransferase